MNFNRKSFLVFISIILIPLNVVAQQTEDPIIANILESLSETQTEDFDYTELAERLNRFKKNKINLNRTSRNQLQELYFLNPLQINALLDHIATNGKLINDLELQSIDGFDLETIKNILYFTTINSPTGFENFTLKNFIKNGENDILIRSGKYLELQKGYDNNENNTYAGTQERVLIRYRLNYQNNIQLALNLEKDAGEKYWNTTNNPKGIDFLSASLFIKDVKKFKKIAIGNYALQFGQGLSLWSGLGFGKGADIFSIAKQDLGLIPYSSINEFSYFRGISSQIKFGRFDFTPFISSIKLDAGTSFNSETNLDEISSLQQSGLHRTESEINNRSKINQQVFGGNFQYNFRKLSIGITAYQSSYNREFSVGNSLYNKFNFADKELKNISLYYRYTYLNTYFFGEFAQSISYGYAYTNGIMSSLSPAVSLVLLHRNYQTNYHSFFNQGLSENTNATNEKGFYSGIQIKPNRKFELNFYADAFKFPWLKFGVDAPSSGYDLFGQFTFSQNKTSKYILRYQFEKKQQNSIGFNTIPILIDVKKSKYRAEIQYQINQKISLKNRVEMVQLQEGNTAFRFGFLAYQDINYHPLSSKLSGNIRLALFETTDFDTRIYAYENDVLYGYSIPGFQNEGVRFYTNLRYNIKRGIDLWLKYAITKYNNLDVIGSGLEEIDGNQRSELKLQVRLQF